MCQSYYSVPARLVGRRVTARLGAATVAVLTDTTLVATHVRSLHKGSEDSIACASNAPFSEWGQTFTDPRLAAAVVDRLTFHAHIINTGADSYRLRTTRAAKAAPRARPEDRS